VQSLEFEIVDFREKSA